MSLRTARIVTLLACSSFAFAAVGCATIPKGQYGVDDIEWIGMKDLSHEALEACLVTRKREATEVRLGISTPTCGQPPFDSNPPSFDLWTLPWTDWPIYDPAIFEVERERIERWYQARGYYQAHVIDVQTFVDGKPVDPNECHGSGSQCELKLVVKLDEGKPTFVKEVEIQSDPPLPAAVMKKLNKALELRPGQRFDESSYEADKTELKKRVINASYARADVSGKVIIDREHRSARVIYKIVPGPSCVFGSVRVAGAPSDVP
ncbi:MAG TPA: POTRA domain-containing protein, partial [Polyangiaceae bacterium]